MNDEDLGKAYKAFQAFNLNYKTGRITDFDPKRWLKVVRAIITGRSPTKRQHTKAKWTPERTAKFKATMARKRELNGTTDQPSTRKGWAKVLAHDNS